MTGFVFAAVLASAVLHASWNFLAKGTAGDFRVLWSSVALWGTASIVPAAYLLARDGFDPRGAAPLAVSVAAHAWYFVMLGSAYRTGDISTAYPVARGIGAAGTAVFGFFVLGEGFSRAGTAGILLVIAGVVLIGKSGFAAGGCRKAYLFAVLTGAGIVGYSAADKVGAAFVRPFLYLGLLNLGIAAATAPLALRGGAAAIDRKSVV